MTASSDLGHGQDFSSKLLHLALSSSKERHVTSSGLPVFSGVHVSEVSATGLSCVPALLPLESFDPETPLIFGMSMIRNVYGALARIL